MHQLWFIKYSAYFYLRLSNLASVFFFLLFDFETKPLLVFRLMQLIGITPFFDFLSNIDEVETVFQALGFGRWQIVVVYPCVESSYLHFLNNKIEFKIGITLPLMVNIIMHICFKQLEITNFTITGPVSISFGCLVPSAFSTAPTKSIW